MTTDIITWELKDWIGLNMSPNISNKDPHYVEDCQNVDFDERKLIIKRRATQSITLSGVPETITPMPTEPPKPT